MERVVDLRVFRRDRDRDGDDGGGEGDGLARPAPGTSRRREPFVSLYDLIPRDFTQTEEIVYGLLMVREILSCVLPNQPAWRGPLFALTDAAHHRDGPRDQAFLDRLLAFKLLLERFIAPHTVRDLGTAVLILNLIGRSPEIRGGRSGPPASGPPA